jgi:hypothetical protein
MIGDTECGRVPKDVNDATWYKVECSNPVTTNSIEITRNGGLILNQVEVIGDSR